MLKKAMITLKKGDCEHCLLPYRYSLWHAGFGNSSYAYCDQCGALALLNYASPQVAEFPAPAMEYQEIDTSWEPLLRLCRCGGQFRKGASPRCPFCNETLSPEHAAKYIEAQALGAAKGWRWQSNWNGIYCMAIEDPENPGALRQIEDPVAKPEVVNIKKRWWVPFRRVRETASTKPV